MATRLLAWNPDSWEWTNLAAMIDTIAAHGSVADSWSCGNIKRIGVGDRAFLIRLGVEPKGIMGSGTITRAPYEDAHYNPAKAATGQTTNFVDVRWDRLLDPAQDPPLPREFLRTTDPFSAMHWDTQSSGVQIPDRVAAALEEAWARHTGGSMPPLAEELSDPVPLIEGARKHIVVNAYERNPLARQRCIDHHGTRCAACGVDLATDYGPVAAGLIHVHHLRPLATIGADYAVDPIADLRPVCPNCHAVIHARTPPYAIEEVRAFLHAAHSGRR